MVVEIFTIVKNGAYILPLYLEHYRKIFPNCIINIFDNNSTDNSVEICLAVGCNVVNFPVYDVYKEQVHKNSVWKNSNADWVVVCDQDELIHVDLNQIPNDVNVIQFEGYNMMDVTGVEDVRLFTWGSRCETYDKCVMFKPTLSGIGFSIGSHFASPTPEAVYYKYKFRLLHYSKQWFSIKNLAAYFPTSDISSLELLYNISLKRVKNLQV